MQNKQDFLVAGQEGCIFGGSAERRRYVDMIFGGFGIATCLVQRRCYVPERDVTWDVVVWGIFVCWCVIRDECFGERTSEAGGRPLVWTTTSRHPMLNR